MHQSSAAMPDVKRATVIIPEGMKELAIAHARSLGQEAKVAMEEYVRRNGHVLVPVDRVERSRKLIKPKKEK
jgi:hypothetical protein